MPRSGPSTSVGVDGFWIDEHAGDRRRVPPLRAADRLRHPGRAPARPGGLPRGRPGPAGPRRRSSSSRRAGRWTSSDYRNWWQYVPGAQLAPSRRTDAATSSAATAIPSCTSPSRMPMAYAAWAGKDAADRGGVGVRGARRTRRRGLHLGRRVRAARPHDGQHLAGRVSLAEPAARTATRARRPSARSRPMATGSSTWPATSGSGPPTSTRRATPTMSSRLLRAAGNPRVTLAGRELQRRAARRAHPAPRGEGRITPLRAELLPALPARGTPAPGDRHIDGAPRFSLPGPVQRPPRGG